MQLAETLRKRRVSFLGQELRREHQETVLKKSGLDDGKLGIRQFLQRDIGDNSAESLAFYRSDLHFALPFGISNLVAQRYYRVRLFGAVSGNRSPASRGQRLSYLVA